MKMNFFVVLVLLLLGTFVSADVIIPNTHFVDKCVKIINVESFSDYVIVEVITGPGSGGNSPPEVNQLDSNICMRKGYKYNRYAVYAIEKSYFDSTSTFDLNLDSSKVFKSNIAIEPYGGYVPDSDSTVKIDLTYKIIDIKDGNLNLGKVAGNTSFSKNIFEIIACFFASLFGSKC